VRTALLSSPMRLCLVSSHHDSIVALWVGETTVTSAHSLAKRRSNDGRELAKMKCSAGNPARSGCQRFPARVQSSVFNQEWAEIAE
jgi:hypothetical protein